MKTYQLALAAIVLMGSSSMALAEEWRNDPTPDHVYYYGPVQHHTAPTPAAKPAKQVHHAPARAAGVPTDNTPDHMYYYGPVAH